MMMMADVDDDESGGGADEADEVVDRVASVSQAQHFLEAELPPGC